MKKRAIQAYIRKRVRQVLAVTWTTDELAVQLMDALSSAVSLARTRNLDNAMIGILLDEYKKVHAAYDSKMSAEHRLRGTIQVGWKTLDRYDSFIREAPQSTDVDVDLSTHPTLG